MKSFYAISCCLFLVAIAFDLNGKLYFAKAAGTLASMMESSEAEKTIVAQESRIATQSGNVLTIAGLASAGLAGLCWCGSLVRDNRQHRRFRWAIPLTLLATYVLVFFIAA